MTVLKTGKNYDFQEFLEECKCIVKEKKFKYIIEYVEISSDEFDKEDSEKENFDEQSSDEENHVIMYS